MNSINLGVIFVAIVALLHVVQGATEKKPTEKIHMLNSKEKRDVMFENRRSFFNFRREMDGPFFRPHRRFEQELSFGGPSFRRPFRPVDVVDPMVVDRQEVVDRPAIVDRPAVIDRTEVIHHPMVVDRPEIVHREEIVHRPTIVHRPMVVDRPAVVDVVRPVVDVVRPVVDVVRPWHRHRPIMF